MKVGHLTVLDALKSKMQWHQARQSLLAENVANAETPGYRGRDLAPYSFEEHLKSQSSATVVMQATRQGHFTLSTQDTLTANSREMNSFEITPDGNGVVLEDEMMKVSANQMDFQAATTLYTRSIKLLRTALGR